MTELRTDERGATWAHWVRPEGWEGTWANACREMGIGLDEIQSIEWSEDDFRISPTSLTPRGYFLKATQTYDITEVAEIRAGKLDPAWGFFVTLVAEELEYDD